MAKDSLKEQGFYQSTAWRKLRLQVLQRDHFLCQHCLKKGRIKKATEVHHVIALEKNPSLGLDKNNLISLCWDCHEETKHIKSRKDYQARVIFFDPPSL